MGQGHLRGLALETRFPPTTNLSFSSFHGAEHAGADRAAQAHVGGLVIASPEQLFFFAHSFAQSFPVVAVNHIEQSEGAAIDKLVAHEFRRPNLVDGIGQEALRAAEPSFPACATFVRPWLCKA